MNGLKTGMTIIDKSLREMFSEKQSEHTTFWSMLVDRTGNILIGEQNKISIWTPDGKFHKTVLEAIQTSQDNTKYQLTPMDNGI
jgi:hypothetical protein